MQLIILLLNRSGSSNFYHCRADVNPPALMAKAHPWNFGTGHLSLHKDLANAEPLSLNSCWFIVTNYRKYFTLLNRLGLCLGFSWDRVNLLPRSCHSAECCI